MKKYGQLFNSTLFISDTLVIFFSWLAAYYYRFYLDVLPVWEGVPPLEQYLWAFPVICLAFWLNVRFCGLYEPLGGKSSLTEYYRIVKVVVLSLFMVAAISFFYRGASYSRLALGYFGLISAVSLVLNHALVRSLFLKLREKGLNLTNVLIVGAGELGQTVAEKIDLHPEIGFNVSGYLTSHPEKVGKTFKNFPVVGTIEQVRDKIRELKINKLFIALPLGAHERLEAVLNNLGEETVDVKVVPDLLRFMSIQSGVEEFDGLPVVSLTSSPLYGWNLAIKRATDLGFSLLAIPVALPLMASIAVLVRLESKGSVFFRQDRVGLDGRVFSMYKFRSMRMNAEDEAGPVWAEKNDHRRTRVGAFLRRTSLDELPQLFNVLKGEMSLVGPRPERSVFVEDFKKSIPRYMLRLKMKAGLTGWAQVNGWRGNTSLEKRIEYDLYYIKNWSWLFDIKIIVMTLWKGFLNKHAY